jgi:hypothetical protein
MQQLNVYGTKIKKNLSGLSVLFIVLIMIVVSSNLNWGKTHWKRIIAADAKGYYAYLPAVFIYHDLNFGFFDEIEKEKYYDKNLYYDYRAYWNEKTISKYYCGTAIAQLPFFQLAHVLSYILDYDIDGYSKLYPVLINLAAIFYLFIGLIYLNKVLKHYQIKDKYRAIVLIAISFGTNIFYYTVVESGMSHIYSFAFISMFIYYGLQYFSGNKIKYVFILAALTGIIVLIRPVNGIILCSLPFLAQSKRQFINGLQFLLNNKTTLVLAILPGLFIPFIQLIIYKLSTGSFFVYSYINEGFNFLNPHFFDILFSYKKGLFVYTPLLFISLWGGYYLWKKNKFEFYSLFIFLILLTYVLSSWSNWWYGGSFSSRAYLEYIPLFAILLGIVLVNIKKPIYKRAYLCLVFVLVILCQVQTYQYRYYQIHWEDMTKEKYWDVFLRVDQLIK